MNSKVLFVAIAIIAAFGTAASAIGLANLNPVAAQDNMTMGGNMTVGNMTGSVASVPPDTGYPPPDTGYPPPDTGYPPQHG